MLLQNPKSKSQIQNTNNPPPSASEIHFCLGLVSQGIVAIALLGMIIYGGVVLHRRLAVIVTSVNWKFSISRAKACTRCQNYLSCHQVLLITAPLPATRRAWTRPASAWTLSRPSRASHPRQRRGGPGCTGGAAGQAAAQRERARAAPSGRWSADREAAEQAQAVLDQRRCGRQPSAGCPTRPAACRAAGGGARDLATGRLGRHRREAAHQAAEGADRDADEVADRVQGAQQTLEAAEAPAVPWPRWRNWRTRRKS